MKKSVVIIGASGLFGSMLRFCAEEENRYSVHGVSLRGVSRNLSSVSHALGTWPVGTVIVNAATVKHSSPESSNWAELQFINSVFPHMLVNICNQNGWWFIQISTDGVFTGLKGNYSENDIPDACDYYGLSKIRGEPAEGALVLRQSIIGPEIIRHESLMGWLASNKGGKINGYKNYLWQGLTSLSLSKILLALIQESDGMTGLLHLFSPYSISKGELLMEIATCFSWNIEVELINSIESIDRSMRSESDLVADFGIKPIQQQLVDLRDFIKEHASCYPKYIDSSID